MSSIWCLCYLGPLHAGFGPPSLRIDTIRKGALPKRDEMNIMDAQFKRPVSQDVICFGPFRLSATERVLENGGVRVRLGSRALDILIALVERPTEVVSKKELIARVWPDLAVEEGSLHFHISALRKALGEVRSGKRYVTNVSGRGYCFVAPISRAASLLTSPRNSLPHSPVGLPPSPTKMVGRDETVRFISEELTARRFFTIVGPGGIGKTTVATAVSRTMLAAFDGAVQYVDFGPLCTPSLAPDMVASTVGLPGNFDDLLAALPAFLRDRRLLLVLDSCEHLIETIAPLAERIFREAPEVHILATSREPLRVEGEQVHRLQPLAFPPDDAPLTAAGALTFPAVQLFVERAAADGSGFELNDAEAPIIGKVCRRLDGIALALELAAGRVGAHGIKGIASLLDGPCRLQWHGRRTALPRHQTLSATLDWSYNLLPEFERAILRGLSVFVGAFSLEAAQFVSAGKLDNEQVAETIAGLVSKSLIAVETNHAATLYRLLDTTRAYVLAKLVDSGERNTVARRHAVYCRELLERTEIASLTFTKNNGAIEAWRHVSNVRAALEWSLSDQGDKEVGTGLAAASAPLFLELSLLTECRIWMERAIAELDGLGNRHEMELQEALAVSLMFTKGNSEEVQAALAKALSVAQALELPHHQMRLFAAQHTFLIRIGDFRGAAAVAEKNEAVAKGTADPTAMMMGDWMLGVSHHSLGDQARARRLCETALKPEPIQSSSMIRAGYDQRIHALVTLARSLWLEGYAIRAVTAATQALLRANALNHPVSLCYCWIYTANVFLWTGDWSEADRIIERLIACAEQYSLVPYHAIGLGLKGELSLKEGNTDAGLSLLTACLDALQIGQHQTLTAVFISNLATGLASAGRPDEADAVIDKAMARDELTGSHFHFPEMMRIKGELLASGPHSAEAENWFSRSLDLAREQSALAWELRTATSLAHLCARQGRYDKAQRVLRPTYDRFTEGFKTPDLRAARHLLGELRLSCIGSDSVEANSRQFG
jgi:predicted ATPase/DNA-binding winged helix-turn-helix (wHTH) protein